MRPTTPMVETRRIALTADEHESLGRLVRESDAAKKACSEYVDQLCDRYAKQFMITGDCSMNFENGDLVIREPQLVMKAS